MLTIKQLFFGILGVNCIFVLVFFISVSSPETFHSNTLAFQEKSSLKSLITRESDENTPHVEPTDVDDTTYSDPDGVDTDDADTDNADTDNDVDTDDDVDTDNDADTDDDDDTDTKKVVPRVTKVPQRAVPVPQKKVVRVPQKVTPVPQKKVVVQNGKSFRNSPKEVSEPSEDTDEMVAITVVHKLIHSIKDRLIDAQDDAEDLHRRRNKVQHVLRWSNPFFLLGGYSKVSLKYFNSYPDGRPYYNKFNYGVINDPDYCELVDFYNIAHPENMFKNMNFFTDYAKNGLVRKDVIQEIGVDTMRRVSRYMNKTNFYSAQYHLDPTITNFFTKRVDIHIYHMIGKHFNCATQMYNHIPGHGVLKRKDLIVDSVDTYAQEYQDQGLSHCFNKKTFFPFSYRLYIKEECQEFFAKINSKKYKDSLVKEPIQYLVKLGFGAHRANGVFLLDKEFTKNMTSMYRGGALCGKISRSMIAQTYVTNPLLLDKDNKFDFRVYMLIASTNPLIVYYHDGFLRVSLETYNKNSDDRNVHLTNTHLAKDAFAQAEKEDPKKAQELRDYQMWTFEKLETYLLQSKKISDPKWLDNELRPAFKRAFIHTARMSNYAFWKESNVYEMFGLDFMLDDELNLWFIECNSSPQLIGTNEYKTQFLIKMLTDLFEIQYGYYRSRMKRMMDVIRRINKEAYDTGAVDYNLWKEDYKAAMVNRFEPEFNISANNSFELIMDLNLSGPKAYFGNLQSECAN